MAGARAKNSERLPTIRLMAGATVVMLVAYIVVSVSAVVSPGSPATALAEPYFSQGWRLFAPHIRSTNYRVEVQARTAGPSGVEVSEWKPITAVELAAVRGAAAPPRVADVSVNLAPEVLEYLDSLSDDARSLVAPAHPMPETPSASQDELVAALGNEPARYWDLDQNLTRLSSMWASAYFGTDVDAIRWRVESIPIPAFERRFSATTPESWTITSSWRDPAEVDQDSIDATLELIWRYQP